jgi:integrating conjugative element membrane protein (TIGR03747 family)
MGEAKASPKATTKHRGVLGCLITLTINVLLCSVLAWFLLLMELSGISLVQGFDMTKMKINNLVDSDNLGAIHTAFITTYDGILQHLTDSKYLVNTKQFLQEQRQQASVYLPSKTSMNPGIQNRAMEAGRQFLFILKSTTLIVFMRLKVFLSALPLLGIAIILGFIDGLAQRDIRKFRGARESTFLFHRSKYTLPFMFFIPLLIYLALPWSISPLWSIGPMAVLLGLTIWLSAQSFKKYV